METKFNFNSAICTSRAQSERLLALGLKKETADMYWFRLDVDEYKLCANSWIEIQSDEEYFTHYKSFCIPAWSLHRLLELSPKSVDQEIPYFTKDGNVELVNSDGIVTKAFGGENLYDTLLDFFHWLIKEGYFNKEFLI